MSDRAAFLRAIAEQPADRTARLVFADFLEETGGADGAVRAEFVRAQVEADTAHPNSNRAAELESRAADLFGAHWLDWWAEVCAAVGLPPPHRPSGVREWLTRKLVGNAPTGNPYKRRWPTTVGVRELRFVPEPLDVHHRFRFCGGFPESLSFLGTPGLAAEFLRKWADVSPLAALDLHGVGARDWRAIDGPHLTGLRALSLGQSNSIGLSAVVASPHLSQLNELHLTPDRSNVQWPEDQYRTFADAPLAGRITRLSVVLADVSEALPFHGAPLSQVTALEVRAPRAPNTAEEFENAALAALDLLSLPHLDHLEEVALDAVTSHALGSADRVLLARLRKLDLTVGVAAWSSSRFGWFLPPGLTDLSLTIADSPAHWLQVLTKSSLVGRLRHLRLNGTLGPNRSETDALLRLARELGADQLETLRVGKGMCHAPAVRAALTEQFGARVRFG